MRYSRSRDSFKSCHYDEHCVCDIVKNIVKAQDEAANMYSCPTSCNRSIHQLLSQGNNNGPQNSTIPFILYCKDSCKPFVGSGVSRISNDNEPFFECVESPVFRAKKFVKRNNCCVRLELLLPVSEGCKVLHCDDTSVCSFFSREHPVTDFLATGICLTVDLNNFFAITCLDAIDPISMRDLEPAHTHHEKY